MSEDSFQELVPEFRYEAVYRMRHTDGSERNRVIRVTPTSASQQAHDAEALRQAHAIESIAPERELVRVARVTGGPDGGADVVLDREEERQAQKSSTWIPHLSVESGP